MRLRLTVFALLLFLLVACGGNGENGVETTDSVNITLATNPANPQSGQVELVATVKDGQGQPINNVEVYIFANHTGMGGMDMQGQATNQGEGRYAITAGDQETIDRTMIELDGTENKERLGANAILAVSLATAKAEAISRGQFLYEHIRTLSRMERTPLLPIPMCNLINGGRHASHSSDIQEFMVLPIGARTFTDGVHL